MSTIEGRELSAWTVPTEVSQPAGVLQATEDLDEAAALIGKTYQPGRLDVPRGSKPLAFKLWTSDLPGLRVNYLSYGTNVSVSVVPNEHYVILVPVSGHVRVASTGERVDASAGRGAVISPSEPVFFENWSDDARILTARLDPGDLESLLGGLVDRSVSGPIRFRLGMDLADPAVGSVLRAFTLLRSELSRPDGLASETAMGAGLTRLLMTGLLLAQPHSYSDLLQKPAQPVSPGNIREAVQFIEDNPAAVRSVADLAQAASVGVRALENGFRQHVGMPPMAYLRQVRLARVHADLLSADPSRTTAAAVARRWGFTHYGRFSQSYRDRYGNSPAKTLSTPPDLGRPGFGIRTAPFG